MECKFWSCLEVKLKQATETSFFKQEFVDLVLLELWNTGWVDRHAAKSYEVSIPES
jgi:hypothetical protein